MIRDFLINFISNSLNRVFRVSPITTHSTLCRLLNIKSICILWNRGLGDIPLAFYQILFRFYDNSPSTEVHILTRADIAPLFSMITSIPKKNIHVTEINRTDSISLREILELKKRHCIHNSLLALHKAKLGDHISRNPMLIPRLTYKPRPLKYAEKLIDNRPAKNKKLLIHIDTETSEFYTRNKNWPIENWTKLFSILLPMGFTICLLGTKKTHHFKDLKLIDLRGETTMNDVFDLAFHWASHLIGPDSGIVNATYYLDACFPIIIVSYWGDNGEGIMKLGVQSPNSLLELRSITAVPLSPISFPIPKRRIKRLQRRGGSINYGDPATISVDEMVNAIILE